MRIASLLIAVALSMGSVAISLTALQLEPLGAARMLGYAGATIRMVVVDDRGDDLPDRTVFRRDLGRFLVHNDVSLAYSAGDSMTIVTLIDPNGRFTSSQGPLQPGRSQATDDPAALVSTALSAKTERPRSLVPASVRVVGSFPPVVEVDGTYPVVLLNEAASTLGAGIYVLTRADSTFVNRFEKFLNSHGLVEVHVAYQPASDLQRLISPPYGPIVGSFAVLLILAAYLEIQLDLAHRHQRLRLLAMCGASTRQIAGVTLRSILWRGASGVCIGAVGSAIVAGMLRSLLLGGGGRLVAAVLIGLGVALVVWLLASCFACLSSARRAVNAVSR